MKEVALSKESWILVLICLTDMASTVLLLSTNAAIEGNPIMSFYLKFGIGTFIMIKLTLIFLPIFIAEYSMQFRPKFTKMMLRSAIAAYVGVYLVLHLGVNVGMLSGSQSRAPITQVTQADILR